MDSAFQLEIWINSNMTNGVSIKQALRMIQNDEKKPVVSKEENIEKHIAQSEWNKEEMRAVILMNGSSVRFYFCFFCRICCRKTIISFL